MNYPKNRYSGPHPWSDKDWLYNECIIKKRRVDNIASEYGCKPDTIYKFASKFGISIPPADRIRHHLEEYQTYEYLYANHIELGKSVPELARENNVSDDTIRYHLKKNGIEIQKVNQHKFRTEEEIDEIVDLYCNGLMSANQIGKKFGTSHTVILHLLRKQGIDTRDMSKAQLIYANKNIPEEFYDAEYLRKLHWDENKTCGEIGNLLGGIYAGTIRRQMHRLGVATKSNSQSKIGLMSGDKHPNWKGGISTLNVLLREYFNTNLAPKVAKRDNYTCQLCGATHTVLHVHHKKWFSEIVAEVLSEHKDLKPNDSNEMQQLYNIIVNDERFLDLDNLITYCKECHLFKIHKYKKKDEITGNQDSDK